MAELLQTLFTAISASVLTAGVFWKLLEKGIDQKLLRQAEDYKRELASELHKNNTVFTRVDKRRADALIEMNGLFRNYTRDINDFSPKLPFNSSGLEPMAQAVGWCVEMQSNAKRVFEAAVIAQLFLPKQFSINVAIWISFANTVNVEFVGTLMLLGQTQDFKAADDQRQKTMMAQAHAMFFQHPYWNHFHVIARRICDDIDLMFSAVGELPALADLPLIPVPKPPPVFG